MKMNLIVIVAVTVALLPSTTSSSRHRRRFECPPPEEIHPCTCESFSRNGVRCNDIESLETVRSALSGRFTDPLPSLEISHLLHSFALPPHALGDVPIKKLTVRGCNLRRIHDAAFDGQDALGFLSLTEDRLTEFPTAALQFLPNLITLSLNDNFLMKVTPGVLDPDSRLRFLFLSGNRLSILEPCSFPLSLHTLVLSRNHLTTLNQSLLHLNQLDRIHASGNRLESVDGEFRGLHKLAHLNLDDNSLSSIDGAFVDQSSLTSLNLAYNDLESVEGGLYPLKHLEHLNISYNRITKLSEDLFRSLNGISSLDLSGNYIRNLCTSIRPLHQLRVLRLSNMELKSLDGDCLKGMKSLQTLDLSQNSLTNIDMVTGHYFPKLISLYVQWNDLITFRHGLKNLRNLYELDISSNHLTNFKSHHLAHNTRLGRFKIEGNSWDCSKHLFDNFDELKARGVELIGAPLCYLEEKEESRMDMELEENNNL